MNKEYFIYIIFEKGLDLENINMKSQNIFNLVDYKDNNNIPKNTNSYIDNMKMKLESKFSWSRYHPKNFDINKDQIPFYLYKNYSSLDKFNEIIKDTNKDITHFKAKDVSIYLVSNEEELLENNNTGITWNNVNEKLLIESKLGIGNYRDLEDTIKLKWIENTEKDKDISTSRLWSMDTEKEKTPIKEKLAFKKLVLEGIKISPYFKENSIQSPSSPLKTEDSYNLDFLSSSLITKNDMNAELEITSSEYEIKSTDWNIKSSEYNINSTDWNINSNLGKDSNIEEDIRFEKISEMNRNRPQDPVQKYLDRDEISVESANLKLDEAISSLQAMFGEKK